RVDVFFRAHLQLRKQIVEAFATPGFIIETADQASAGPTGLAAPFRIENDVVYRCAQGIACDPHDPAGNVLGHGRGFEALDFVDGEVAKLGDVVRWSTLVETPSQPKQRR